MRCPIIRVVLLFSLILFCVINFCEAQSCESDSVAQSEGFVLNDLGVACRDGDLRYIKQRLKVEKDQIAMSGECFEYDVLFAAIHFDKPSILRFALKKTDNINDRLYSDEYGLTLLTYACINSNVNIARVLLNHKANVEGCQSDYDLYKIYPIFIAIEKNNVGLVRLLLKRKARTDVRDAADNSPLMLAEKLDYDKIYNVLQRYSH